MGLRHSPAGSAQRCGGVAGAAAAAAAIALLLGFVFGAGGPSPGLRLPPLHSMFLLMLLPCDSASRLKSAGAAAATGRKQETGSFPSLRTRRFVSPGLASTYGSTVCRLFCVPHLITPEIEDSNPRGRKSRRMSRSLNKSKGVICDLRRSGERLLPYGPWDCCLLLFINEALTLQACRE
jgi:hypothetical protein